MAGGRPTKFKDEYCEQATKLGRLGLLDKQIADFFEITESTLYEWKLKHPEFSEALKKGKIVSDIEVSESLYKRALGFEIVEFEDIMYKGKKETLRYVKQVLPDTTAIIFYLKNRQKEIWKDKQNIDHTSGDKELTTPFVIEKTVEKSH